MAQPADQERGGDVVRKIGDDLAWCGNQHRKVQRERVGLDHLEPAARGNFQLSDSGDGARIDLDRDDILARAGEECPGEATWSGPDLDDVGACEVAGDPDDPGRDVPVEKEMLAEAVACIKAMPRDDVAERREGIRQSARLRALSARSGEILLGGLTADIDVGLATEVLLQLA